MYQSILADEGVSAEGTSCPLIPAIDRCGATDIFKTALASFDPIFKERMVGDSSSTVWSNLSATTRLGDHPGCLLWEFNKYQVVLNSFTFI